MAHLVHAIANGALHRGTESVRTRRTRCPVCCMHHMTCRMEANKLGPRLMELCDGEFARQDTLSPSSSRPIVTAYCWRFVRAGTAGG